jgi:hypothetical protein
MGTTGNVGCAALDGCASPAVGGVAGPTVGVSVIRGWAFLAGCTLPFLQCPKPSKLQIATRFLDRQGECTGKRCLARWVPEGAPERTWLVPPSGLCRACQRGKLESGKLGDR